MARVTWVGRPDNWKPPAWTAGADVILPADDDSVIEVAKLPGRHLSLRTAVACVSRVALRTALEGYDLNPDWAPFPWRPGVIKAPASVMNLGVRFLPTNDLIRQLKLVAPNLAKTGVMEEFLGGTAVEVNGAVVGDQVRLFPPLQQTWNEDSTRILKYEAFDEVSVVDPAHRTIEALCMRDTTFCIEFRYYLGKWWVVEAHARLADDPRVFPLLEAFDWLVPVRVSQWFEEEGE